MTVTLVHRPTRTTIPVRRPEPAMLAAPPSLADDSGGRSPLQFMLPVIGAMSSVVMMVVLRNGQPLFLMVAALVFVVAIVGGVGFALTARGRQARQHRAQRELYLNHLEQVRRDLARRADEARSHATELHPEPGALVTLIRDPARLWERRRRDTDHLEVRVGTGPVRWFDLSVPPAESPLQPHDPFLLGEAQLVVEQAQDVAAMPVTAGLAEASVVAVVGPRDHTVATVRSLLLQLASHHGPDDLQIAAAFAPDRAEDWHGLDLLPHVHDADLFDGPMPARRVAPDVETLSHVLGATLTDRLQHAHSARRAGTTTAPPSRLVVVLDDHGRHASALPVGDGAMLRELGITVVHLLDNRLDEPRDVDLRLTLAPQDDSEPSGTLVTWPGTPDAVEAIMKPDLTPPPLFAATARAMAAMRLSHITQDEEGNRVLDVHELLGFPAPEDLDVTHLWKTRTPEDFLRVPFATDDLGNAVHLDLKESAQLGMGPHGICVGATGSGKSEMLRTLILSLALTHPPEDLSMILVDYKGGAAFAPFARLPHLAGLIDNLADDPQLTTRARASLQGEVVRRQRLLKDADSSPSITHYRELRTTRPDLPPMPHLFVVIDEFGELLTAEPEFIDLFLQIGRIGRSIGVHLLLSSQRIEGGKLRGLDTYLSYRLGLRTFSDQESQVVLATPDAYHLPALPGYGYLKVDTSVYTRFRAGFVSGPVIQQPSTVLHTEQPSAMVLPVFNGLSAASSDDGELRLTRPETGRNLVEECVDRLRDDARAVRPVWLPPLPDRVALGHVVERAGSRTEGLSVVLGLRDDPTRQEQDPWRLDLARAGGHVAVIGAPQTGRSTLLRTLAASLSLTFTPRDVVIYGMDLTGSGLQRIEPFPHVGGIAVRSRRDRLVRLLEELAGMIALREQVFRTYGVDSVAHLRTMHSAGHVPELQAPDVVVLVDGYGLLRQDFEELETPFTELMQRASGLGIHLVLGLTRWSELRMGHQALFGTRIELRLNDPAESSIDRKLSATLSPDTPGRALLDDSTLAQVALPTLDAVNDDAIGDDLEALAQRTASAWSGPAAAPIRLLPMHLAPEQLPDAYDEPDAVPLGLRQDTMETAFWEFTGDDQHLIVLGDAKCGKSTLLRTVAQALVARFSSDELAIAVVDTRGRVPNLIDDAYLAAHARTAGQARGLATSIAAELENRPGRSPQQRAHEPRIVVLVDDHDIISAGGTEPLAPLLPYLPNARDLNLHLVVTRPVAGAARAMYTPLLQVARDTGGAMLLMAGERSEGQLAGRLHAEHFPPGRGRYVRRGATPFVIQVAETPEAEQ